MPYITCMMVSSLAPAESLNLPRFMWIVSLDVWASCDVAYIQDQLSNTGFKKKIRLLVQLRAKDQNARQYWQLCAWLVPWIQSLGHLVCINDRVDIALACHADGVHLPEISFDAGFIKQKYPQWIVGQSYHQVNTLIERSKDSLISPDYVTLSPIFNTASKPHAKPLGLDVLAYACAGTSWPVFALGGMSAEHIESAFKHGAYGVASMYAWL